MANERDKAITKTVELAVKILEEKPHLKYFEAMKEAKEKVVAEENKSKGGCKHEI